MSNRLAPRNAARLVAALLVLFVLFGVNLGSAGASVTGTSDDERAFYNATNGDRAANGLAALSYDAAASDVARSWSQTMASNGSLYHNPNLARSIAAQVTPQWTRLGENVGVGYDVAGLERAFMASPGHRANILGDFNRVGIGTVRGSDGRLWVTVVFIKGPAIASQLQVAATPSGAAWYLRNALSTGTADTSLSYGAATDRAIACDWNGDGIDTVGIYRNGAFYLRNMLTSGVADTTFGYGMPGDQPVCGDWDGDGIDTVGVYRNGAFYLRNANTTGGADLVLGYGVTGDRPVIGDWNGDGIDTIAIYRNGVFYQRDTNTSGVADRVVGYGMAGDTPVVGDWNGDGVDTIGVHRKGAFYLRNTNTTGVADLAFLYGNPTDAPLTGDWDGNGTSSTGIVRPQ